MILRDASPRPLRVAAIGRTHWLYDAIEAVAARGHEIVLIGTAPAAPEYLRTERDFVSLAGQLGCPSFVTTRLEQEEIVAAISAADADVCISMNWPGLIRAATLARFPMGVVNAHPGDLPRYRGNACPNWAILQGERSVVLTLHRMTEILDAGPILARHAIPIDDTTYIADVYERLTAMIPAMYADLTDALAADTVIEQEQPSYPWEGMRCHPRRPVDGLLDWSLPAVQLARLVRASAEPFAGAFSYVDGQLLRVWRARAVDSEFPMLGVPGQVIAIDASAGIVHILCGEGILELSQVSLGEGERMQPTSMIRSTRQRLGVDLVAMVAELQARLAALEAERFALGSAG